MWFNKSKKDEQWILPALASFHGGESGPCDIKVLKVGLKLLLLFYF